MHKTSLLCPLFLHTVVALVMLRTISKMMIIFSSFLCGLRLEGNESL